MPSQLEVFFLPADFESVGMTSHKQGVTAKTVSKWRPPKSLLSKRIAGTSEAETSVTEKVECLLDIGDNKKVEFLMKNKTLTQISNNP